MPSLQNVNDSSLIAKRLTNQIENYLKNGNVGEASILAIVSLSSYDSDAVGAKTIFLKTEAQFCCSMFLRMAR